MILDIVASYHCMQFQRKFNISSEIQENSKKKKKHSEPDLALLGPNSGSHFFVFRYHGQLSSYITSEKTNDPILRKLSDRWTDGLTERGRNVECPK